MKVALSLGMFRPSRWEEMAVLGDQLGYESIWMPEHLVFPVASSGSPNHGQEHPPVPANVPVSDVFCHLGYLAGKTTQIHLGTCVYNIGLRHPFSTARGVATLDQVSGGRVELGIGASWLREEWEAVGLDFDTRGARVDEAIEVCRRLWRDEVIEYHGAFFDFEPVMFEPKPVQGSDLPLHIGGDGPAALRRAATVGTGWFPMNHAPEQLPASIAKIAELRAAAGVEGVVEITAHAPDASLETLERLASLGVHRAIVRPFDSSRQAVEGLEAFARDLLETASALETTEP
jgi:probable F420-dependent oxidoreductase